MPLAGGSCIEDLEQYRGDDALLDMLSLERLSDPTTAGDFCRRFRPKADIDALQEAVHESRLRIWRRQPASFFDEAIVDAGGTIEGAAERLDRAVARLRRAGFRRIVMRGDTAFSRQRTALLSVSEPETARRRTGTSGTSTTTACTVSCARARRRARGRG